MFLRRIWIVFGLLVLFGDFSYAFFELGKDERLIVSAPSAPVL